MQTTSIGVDTETCAANETDLARLTRYLLTGVLMCLSLPLLSGATAVNLLAPVALVSAHLLFVVCGFVLLGSSAYALRRPLPALQIYRLTAVLALADLLALALLGAQTGGIVPHGVALLFGLLVAGVVIASRLCRNQNSRAAACNCGH